MPAAVKRRRRTDPVNRLTPDPAGATLPDTMGRGRKVPDARVAYIQYLLAKKQKTQDDVAREAGVHKSTISLYLTGERNDPDTRATIVRALLKLTGKRSEAELFPDPLP